MGKKRSSSKCFLYSLQKQISSLFVFTEKEKRMRKKKRKIIIILIHIKTLRRKLQKNLGKSLQIWMRINHSYKWSSLSYIHPVIMEFMMMLGLLLKIRRSSLSNNNNIVSHNSNKYSVSVLYFLIYLTA